MTFLAFLLGLALGALVVAVLPIKYVQPLFVLGANIREWLNFGPK